MSNCPEFEPRVGEQNWDAGPPDAGAGALKRLTVLKPLELYLFGHVLKLEHPSPFQRSNGTCIPWNHIVLLEMDPSIGKPDHAGFEDQTLYLRNGLSFYFRQPTVLAPGSPESPALGWERHLCSFPWRPPCPASLPSLCRSPLLPAVPRLPLMPVRAAVMSHCNRAGSAVLRNPAEVYLLKLIHFNEDQNFQVCGGRREFG